MSKHIHEPETQVYQTITGRRIPLSELSDAEFAFLDLVAKKYNARQDWTRFAAWWNGKFNTSGLSTASIVYRICQDLEARLGINQGKLSPPDYRDYLAELIDTQFGSRQDFCRATGVDPGQLSRVLAGRDNLSMKVLLEVLKALDARLVIQTQEESLAQTSVDRAAEAIIVALVLHGKRSNASGGLVPACSVASTPSDVGIGTTPALDRTSSFPNVHDIEKVTAGAQSAGIDKRGGPSEFMRGRFEGIRIQATGQNIITIGDGNQVEARFKDVGEALANLADAIKASEELDDSAKLDLVADINSMQDQLAKMRPNKGVLQSLWAGVETAAKAAGIVEAVTKVSDLLGSVLS